MTPEESNFQTFFSAKVKDRGLSLRKLSETSGIAPAHLDALFYGRYGDLPSAPYVRGYLVRLGKLLDFDGEVWWEQLKKERAMKNSGPADLLPGNRFVRRSPAKLIGIGIVILAVMLYLAFQIPIILGKPKLTVSAPASNPFTTGSSTVVIEGIVRNADSLSLNGDVIPIAPDGSWQKTVLLQDGMNTFQITAKKLLGGETDAIEQVLYQNPALPAASGTLPGVIPGAASGTLPAAPTSTAPAPTSGPAKRG